MNWIYGTRITEYQGDFVVTVRDLPEVVTSGDNYEEAVELAHDAIEVVLAGRMKRELDLPLPTPLLEGEIGLPLAPNMAAKASIYHLWKQAGLSKIELARRMSRTENVARRILDPNHGTTLDLLETAARALGSRLIVGLP